MEFFSFGNIIVYIDKFIKFINSIFFVILIIGISFALIISPVDYLQGDSVRIMYVHVPSAWIGLSIFSLIAVSTILNFIFKIKNLFLFVKSLAPIGLLFTCLSIGRSIHRSCQLSISAPIHRSINRVGYRSI